MEDQVVDVRAPGMTKPPFMLPPLSRGVTYTHK
jgi:hypothetical protein